MRNLLLFLARYGHLLLFLFLEFICFSLIVQFNDSQNETWINSVNLYTGRVQSRADRVNEYLRLQQVNDSLLLENSALLSQIIDFKVAFKDNAYQAFESKDTLIHTIIPSRVCAKTIHLRNNFFTLCKGENHGIEKGMGVITSNGLIGVVKSVQENYSDVILLLHSQSRISVAIKDKDYFGNLVWQSNNKKRMKMEAVPKYANLNIGDTIVTSGYSNIFPGGLLVGKVTSFAPESGGNNYEIQVELFNDIETAEYVYVIDIYNKKERELLFSNQKGSG